MNTTYSNFSRRQAATNGLAVVGFVALVALGMWLAVYSARFVPTAVNRIGAAAVSLSGIFRSSPAPSLSVISTASTTIPFGTGTTTDATSTPTTSTEPSGTGSATPAPGKVTNTTYPVGGSTGTPVLSGLPDLTATITAVGYLTSTSTDSFVASTTVPHSATPAVKFTIKNIGTNSSGLWRFSATIPTSSNSLYQSVPQQSLNPGDYIDYTLGFSQPNAGSNQEITIVANFDHSVTESSLTNNSTTTKVTILGS